MGLDIGSLATGAMSLFGSMGGGGGGDTFAQQQGYSRQAADEIIKYAQQAGKAETDQIDQAMKLLQDFYNRGIYDLGTYYNVAKTEQRPFIRTGLSAYDQYLGTLGVAIPEGGTYADLQREQQYQTDLANYNQNVQQQNQQYQAALADYNARLASQAQPQQAQVSAPTMLNNGVDVQARNMLGLQSDIIHPSQYSGAVKNYLMQNPGNILNNQGIQNAISGALGGIPGGQNSVGTAASPASNPLSIGPPPTAPTFGPAPTRTEAPMVTQSTESVLGKFFDTPEYQMLFGNSGASVDPNASVLDRFGESPISQLLFGNVDYSKSPQERFQASPGYQFMQDEGRKALERSASARGLLESGSFAKDLNTFSQGVANQEFGGYLDRVGGAFNQYGSSLDNVFRSYQDRLAQISGMGYNSQNTLTGLAANQGANLAQQNALYGSQLAQALYNKGDAQANSLLAQGGALSGMYNNMANIAGAQGAANVQQNQNMLSGVQSLFNGLFGGGGNSGGGFGSLSGGLF